MINLNGDLFFEENIRLSTKNRAFKYGDAIFETIKVLNKKIVFWEDHYFRLMASMRMLRMKIPMSFTLEFLEQEILKTIETLTPTNSYRVRLNVYRKKGGFYTPTTNNIDYLIEATTNASYQIKEEYHIDLYKDFYNFSGLLSTIKTNNRMVNTLASIFANENELDNCILLNERKGVVEATNANIFILKDTLIKTPSLSEGCINGIARKKIIELVHKNKEFTLQETIISPFEIQKADEVFISNTIIGIQPVTKYRKKVFATTIGKRLANSLHVLQTLSR